MKHPAILSGPRIAALCVAFSTVAACAAGSPDDTLSAVADPGGAAGHASGGEGGGLSTESCPALDLDAVDQSVSPEEHARFEQAAGSDAALIFDPPSGALMPASWPSPTFLVHSEQLPEAVQLRIALGPDQVLRYTTDPEPAAAAHPDSVIAGAWWTIRLPADTWDSIRCRTSRVDYQLMHLEAGATAAAGSASGTLSLLEGVDQTDLTYLGIEQPATLSLPASFAIERLAVESGTPQTLVQSSSQQCIGCHTSSPDGQDLIYQRPGSGGWRVDVVRPLGAGQTEPSPVLASAAGALLDATSLMLPSASAGAWSDSDGHWLSAITNEGRIALLQLDANVSTTTTLSLAPALAEKVNGAPLRAASAVLAPDASSILFVATDSMIDGYFDLGQRADLWSVPVTLAKDTPPLFGTPAPLPHVSGTDANETHPALSHDGQLITYTRTAPGSRGYDEETAEIWVMPADGSAAPTRLASNDAPSDASTYAGLGLTSSWSRFGQSVLETPDGSYYFLLFSSRRGSGELWEDRSLGSNHVPGRPIPRLYLTMVLRHPDGSLDSYPALLVPGQRPDQGAHTATFVSVTSVEPPPPPAN